jgi:hypothetical protein
MADATGMACVPVRRRSFDQPGVLRKEGIWVRTKDSPRIAIDNMTPTWSRALRHRPNATTIVTLSDGDGIAIERDRGRTVACEEDAAAGDCFEGGL